MKRLAIFGALLFGSGLALASPSGHKWFPGSLPVHYRVFNHTTINGMPANSFTASILPRVQEAFLNWTSTRIASTAWRSQYDGTFSSPADHTAVESSDNLNRVIWLGGAEWRYNQSTLGLTTTLFFPNTGQIVDADMELNNNIPWNNNGSLQAFDYESVVLHEAGHFLGLDHTNAGAAVMFPSVQNGQIKRTLNTLDINDVTTVYPGNGTAAQGNPCTMQSQCTPAGLFCRKPQGSSGGSICTVDCTSNANACSTVAPFTCQNADTGKACLPPPASVDYCKFCVDGTDCSTGQCLTDGSGHNWCTNACSGSAPCPSGSECLDVNTGGGCGGTSCICAPAATGMSILCPGQCTGSACAAPGYACVSGTCEATGNEGDCCELSGLCKNCLICIGTAAQANCRRCCAGNGMGATCNACPNATCTGGQQCVTLSGTVDKVCYPTGGADLCQACGGATTCLNGNTCIGGKCHASCNPVSPGSCPACQPTSPTAGLCACPGEERNEGEACGGATVAACRTGLTCSSGMCRRPCAIGNPGSCPSGAVCTSVSGVAVCVADTAGSRCAACNGTSCGAGLSCYQGRCYTTCNVSVKNGPCDYSCVDVGGGTNVCACDDQIHGSGEACGANPIAACSDQLLCIGARCLGECNPNFSTCPILTECKLLAGTQFTFVCQPIDMGGTGGGGGGGGVGVDCTPSGATCPTGTTCKPNGDGTATCRSDSQGCDPNSPTNTCPANTLCRQVDNSPGRFTCQSPIIDNGGCGCNSGTAGAALLLFGLALMRRRRTPSPPEGRGPG